jgi:hypothetical protein
LSDLKAIEYDGLKERITELESIFKEFQEGGDKLLSENDVLQIGIVGQVKAGKSSFLNSLFFDGEDVLPRASTPMTAGLTVIEYAEKNVFEVEYFNETDWKIFVKQDEEYKKREQEVRAQNPNAPESIIAKEIENRTSDKVRSAHEMVSCCTPKAESKIGSENDKKEFFDIKDLQNVLEQYVGARGEYTSVVKSLYIKMKDDRLKGLRIVDTPGVNDPVVSREDRTRTFLHSCHGVFLLSASTDFMGSGDVNFLNNRIGGSGIGSVVILASKFDSVLQDLGADREMNGKECDDLFDVSERQTKSFKRRLRDISDTIDENLRGRLKMDTTAGIGYSIAKKSAQEWDEIERNVVNQMKRYYPDYFKSEKDIKESFMGLAKIDDIRTDYLEGSFMKNKDSIIAEKVQAFFVKYKKEISETITTTYDEFKSRRDQLNKTTVEEIKKQKEQQAKLFDGLRSDFGHLFQDFSRGLQSQIKSINNKIGFQTIREIPTETTTGAVTCKGALWGHNTNDRSYEQINTHALGDEVRKSIEQYAKDWNEQWKKLFEEERKNMANKLTSSITEFEKKVMSSSFDDDYYRRLINQALDDLRSNKELSIRETIDNWQGFGDDISSRQFKPSGTDELKDSQVDSYLRQQLAAHKEQLIRDLRNLANGVKEDVSKEVNKNVGEAVKVIDGMKTSFAEKLKKEGESYLESLEKDLQKKTEVLKKVEAIVDSLQELSNLYK